MDNGVGEEGDGATDNDGDNGDGATDDDVDEDGDGSVTLRILILSDLVPH